MKLKSIIIMFSILMLGSCEYIENIINPPVKIEYVMITPTPGPTEIPEVEEEGPPFDGLVYKNSFDENKTSWRQKYGEFFIAEEKLVTVNDNSSFSLFISPYQIKNGRFSAGISFNDENKTSSGGLVFRSDDESGYLVKLASDGLLQLTEFTIIEIAAEDNITDENGSTTDTAQNSATIFEKTVILQRDISDSIQDNTTISIDFRDHYLSCAISGEELFVESIPLNLTAGGIGLFGETNSSIIYDDIRMYDYDAADPTTCGQLVDKNNPVVSVPVYAYTKYGDRVIRIGRTKADKEGAYCFNLPEGLEYFFTTEIKTGDQLISGTIVDLDSTSVDNKITLNISELKEFNGTINPVFVRKTDDETEIATTLVASEMTKDEYLFIPDPSWQKIAKAHDNGNKREEYYINPAVSKIGVWTTWYENGRTEKEVYFYTPKGDLVMHGPYKEWFESGVDKITGFYREGMKSGLWKEWDDKGRIRFEGHYKNGKKVGLWISYEDWFSDFLTERLWLQKGDYNENGKKDGEWRSRSKENLMDGTEKVEIYKNGKLIEEKIEKVGEGIEIDEGMS